MEKTSFQSLRRFNLIMGALHLVQGIMMLILASTVIQKIAEFKPTIAQIFLQYNTETQSLETAF